MKIVTDDLDFDSYFKEQELDSAKIRPAADWASEVVDRFHGQTSAQHWTPVGFEKMAGKFDLRPGELTLWAGVNGHGKALELDTPIPTPGGWTTMGALKEGEQVFDESGTPCTVIFVTPVMLDRPCYRVVFSDGAVIVADADHLWETHTALARRSWRRARDNSRLDGRPVGKFGSDQSQKRTSATIVTTKEIAATLLVTAKAQFGDLNHSIPVCGALKTLVAQLPVDPYVLGAWLGDGSSDSASIACNDAQILAEIAATGVVITKRAAPFMHGLTGGLQGRLASLNVLKNKHIPTAYLRASFEQRLALLQGLMDTDGHITDYGRCEFTSMRQHLAEQVLELVLSCGLQAKMITGRAMLNGKDCGEKYRITFTPDISVFRLVRKADKVKAAVSCRIKHRFIVSCEPISSVPVRCIQVDSPSHLYLASKAMIPTHNTTFLSNIMLKVMQAGQRVCLASLEMRPRDSMAKMTQQAAGVGVPSPRYIRGFHAWTNDRLWVYDHVGKLAASRALAVATYVRKELGIDHLVIDSLMKCGLGTDDYTAQKDFVDGLCAIARDTGLHIHLVCHMRKGENESKPAEKFDVKGASEVVDLADNLIIVWKNLPKIKDLESADREKNLDRRHELITQLTTKPDAFVRMAKQRHHSWEGSWAFWFDRASQQFLESPHTQPVYNGLDLVLELEAA